MSQISKSIALSLSIPALLFISITAGFVLFVSDKPAEAADDVAQQCNISLALDRSTSMTLQRRQEAYQTVMNLFNPSNQRNNPGIGDERFRIGFTSFGTASTGYTGGNTPYFSGSSGNSRPNTKYDNYYPSTNANNGYGQPVWTPTDPSNSGIGRFRERLEQLYQPDRSGIIPMANSSGNTNWEAGLSRNLSGTLPGNYPRASSFWWNRNGNWTTNNVGAGRPDYNLGLDQPGQADVIILITDGVPSLSDQYLVPQTGNSNPPSAQRVSDENAKAAGDAARYWRGQNRQNGAGKKAVYGIIVGENDNRKSYYMDTAFGSNSWQTYDDFSQLDQSLRLDIIRLCAITWSTAGTTTLTTPRTTAPGERVRWQHEVHRNSDNNWAIKAGQVFNYKVITYRLDGTNRQNISSEDGTFRAGQAIRDSNSFITEQSAYVVGAGDYGKQICSYIEWNPSVESPNRAPSGENQSTPVCTLVGKVPLVNILGGDIRAGAGSSSGDIITKISTTDGKRYGSWAEYGALAAGNIADFESGGVLSSEPLRTGSSILNRLTFANNPLNGRFQLPMTARSTPASSTFDKTDSTMPGNWNNTNATSYTTPQSGTHRVRFGTSNQITINGANNISGVVMIDAPNASVVINSNISYRNGPYSSIDQIPLVLINAKSIRFGSSVNRIDAGLQASGAISTCGNPASISTYYENLRLNNCNQQLRLNGFVSAGSLYLRRTAGADGNSDNSLAASAEQVNLRADAILKINELTKSSQTSIRTTSISELPPRL